jgi:hypothetical protein
MIQNELRDADKFFTNGKEPQRKYGDGRGNTLLFANDPF